MNDTIANIKKEINLLQEKIWEFEQKSIEEYQKNIIPFLKLEKVKAFYIGSYTYMLLKLNNVNDEKELYKYISGKENENSNHIGCPINEHTSIHLNDGQLTLYLTRIDEKKNNISQKEYFIKTIKELGIEVDFEQESLGLRLGIEKYYNEIKEIESMEEELRSKTDLK